MQAGTSGNITGLKSKMQQCVWTLYREEGAYGRRILLGFLQKMALDKIQMGSAKKDIFVRDLITSIANGASR
ncbi:hypothetical protein NPIL_146431 [Nephila pilipes]|uniref:Uncharacterized protein n=1 Tax=Nephila pilipes TaxID=299642 RepID=A0A8X6UBV7_NEPPI|nr:hypothetical protein NPIL_146431 [Nephila pilipes]